MSLQQPYEVYLRAESLNGIHQVCKAEMPDEAIGLLVGSKNMWGGHQYTLVEGFLAGQAKATRIRVEFEKGALGPLIGELRRSYPGSMIVGWYHSHPGYGCFLSAIDVETQRSYFRESYHVAIVVDPVKDTFDIFKLEGMGGGYRPCSFVVLEGASEHVVR